PIGRDSPGHGAGRPAQQRGRQLARSGTIGVMATPNARTARGLDLEFPQSLAVYGTYTQAQRSVDHLADNGFPVQNCMIVGTDLKQVERITGRLTTGRVALIGAFSGVWLGLFVGLILSMFGEGSILAVLLSTALI